MIPIRFIFRSRWAALAWAAGICLSAAQFAGDGPAPKGTTNNADDNAVAADPLLAAFDKH